MLQPDAICISIEQFQTPYNIRHTDTVRMFCYSGRPEKGGMKLIIHFFQLLCGKPAAIINNIKTDFFLFINIGFKAYGQLRRRIFTSMFDAVFHKGL